jgi:hypothetical protein
MTAFATLVTIADSASRSSDPSWGSGVQVAARLVHGADRIANAIKAIQAVFTQRTRIGTFILFDRKSSFFGQRVNFKKPSLGG